MDEKHKTADLFSISQSQPHHVKSERGFTLIQLLTTIAIIAISLGIGIPSVSAILETNRMAYAMNTLSHNFALARSEAVTRYKEVIICKSRDGRFCTRKGGWEQGWLVYVDADGDERRGKDEKILWIQEPFPADLQIRFSAFRSNHYVHYWPTGFTKMNGTFTFCHMNGQGEPKALILNKIGRMRKSQTRWDGSPLTCG